MTETVDQVAYVVSCISLIYKLVVLTVFSKYLYGIDTNKELTYYSYEN